jgi:CheY-like chemotaxis protein
VLIVDPDATSRRIFRAHLSGVGLTVDEATDALDGLDALRAAFNGGRPYDLAFVEVQMPHMDGLELAAEIRADPALARLPLVALASTGDTDNRERARRAGIQRYLTKPATVDQLLGTLAELLLPDGAAERRARLAGPADATETAGPPGLSAPDGPPRRPAPALRKSPSRSS